MSIQTAPVKNIPFKIATDVNGTLEDEMVISATNEKEALKRYNQINYCQFYKGKIIKD